MEINYQVKLPRSREVRISIPPTTIEEARKQKRNRDKPVDHAEVYEFADGVTDKFHSIEEKLCWMALRF